MLVLILLVCALVLALMDAFGVPSRAPLLAIAVICLAGAAMIARGLFT